MERERSILPLFFISYSERGMFGRDIPLKKSWAMGGAKFSTGLFLKKLKKIDTFFFDFSQFFPPKFFCLYPIFLKKTFSLIQKDSSGPKIKFRPNLGAKIFFSIFFQKNPFFRSCSKTRDIQAFRNNLGGLKFFSSQPIISVKTGEDIKKFPSANFSTVDLL